MDHFVERAWKAAFMSGSRTVGEVTAAGLPTGSASERAFVRDLIDRHGYVVQTADMIQTGHHVFWPTSCVESDMDCQLAAAHAIEAFAVDAMENDPDEFEPGMSSHEEMVFWHRVAQESKRLALWAVHGLGINGRSITFGGK